jgi:hypothetical protein
MLINRRNTYLRRAGENAQENEKYEKISAQILGRDHLDVRAQI